MTATAQAPDSLVDVAKDHLDDDGVLHVSELATMRALTHPLRARIFMALRELGPSTATRLGQALGESSGLMSYHLRRLARYGLVIDHEEQGTGRERWWRPTAEHLMFDCPPEGSAAYERELLRVRHSIVDAGNRALGQYLANEGAYPPEWRDAATFVTDVIHVTPAELDTLAQKLSLLIADWHRAAPESRPDGALPVRVSLQAVPTRAP